MTLLLIGLLVLAVAAAAELGARRWIRRRGAYYVFPPGLRLRLHPDREAFPELEPVVRFEVNSEGERGSEVPRVKPGESLYRILVVGGSQPEGYLLDQDTSWPGALQRLLATPEHLRKFGASAVHVGNIARSGVGAEALDLVLARVLPRYPRLAAIIVLVGASDMLRWLEQGAPPAPPARARPGEVFRCHPEGPFGWSPSQLAAVELLRRARRRWLRAVQVHEHACRWIAHARAMRARAREVQMWPPDAAPMLKDFEVCLSKAIWRAKAHADRVIVVRQSCFAKSAYTPEEAAHMWHGGTGQAWREEVTTYYSLEAMSMLMTQLNCIAARVADGLSVEQIDLVPILDDSLDTYYDFFHLTPRGAQIVAAAVAASLLRQPLPFASPRAQRGRAVETHSASLALRAS
jgi:lysophospholipase L1-like esterase